MIDINKKYQTASGCPVTLISNKGQGDYQIIGFVGERVHPTCWNKRGENIQDHTLTLVEVPADDYGYCEIEEGNAILGLVYEDIAGLKDDTNARVVLRINANFPYDTLVIKEGDPLWPKRKNYD